MHLFQGMEYFVPTLGTLCSSPWNNLFQPLEQVMEDCGI